MSTSTASIPADLLPVVLAVSLTAINVLRPCYEPETGKLVDFSIEYLNPAAQRMTGLPERPGGTMQTRFADTFGNGVFDFYQRVFETQEAGNFAFNYQADGFDNYFRVAAQRQGEWLVISFTDTADQDRSPVELALRESQQREKQALAEAEAQRERLYEVLRHLPALVAVYRGPDHRYEFVNSRYQQYFPAHAFVGQPIREVIPESVEQGVVAALNRVYQTGEPFHNQELEVYLDFDGTGKRQQTYLNLFFLAMRNAQGFIDGVLDFSYEVTAQVQARQQVQRLNEELVARNEDLVTANLTLGDVQQQLQQLNQTLETQVAERIQQLAEQQTLIQQILNQAPAYVATFSGPTHVYSYFNDAFARDLTQGRAELGRTFADLFPELASQGFVAVLDGVYASGQPAVFAELPVVLRDPLTQQERTLYVNIVYQPLRNAQGHIQGLLAFATDVSDAVLARQQAAALQAELLAAAQRRAQEREDLYQIFAQTPAAICLQRGPAHRYEYANQAYQDFFPGRQLLGRTVVEALPETVEGGVVALLDHVYQTGETYYGTELPLQMAQPDGSFRQMYFTFTYQAMREHGQIVGISTFAYNVAEQVLARQQVQRLNEELTATNQELHESNAQLRRTNVDLDTFVYTASHDLKAPITNIEGIMLALREHLTPEVQQDEVVASLLDLSQHTVERFRLTINQLTDISKLQLAHAGAAEPVALAAVVEDVRLDLVTALQAAATQLHLEVAPDLVVSFSPANLRSIVYNLLSNAIKYRDPARPSVVAVRAACTATTVVLTVQDNGLGLTEAQQQRLFGLFQRLHTHVEGTGVGLYILKRLVENAGGTVAVQSAVGVGSTFTVTFPV